MSHVPNASPTSSWQASLMSIEADALKVRRSDNDEVQQVQAKRQEARAAAARLAEAKRRLTAPRNRNGQDEAAQAALNATVVQAEQQQCEAIAAYEKALKTFHKQRANLRQQQDALTQRRDSLMREIPQGTRQAYSDLLGTGIPDPVACARDGRCAACGQDLSSQTVREPWLCPACHRLVIAPSV
jgi:predicted  nucleic acid-binding Zn-ribbon protein